MTLVRTDIHRPSVIVPAEYVYIAPDHVRIDSLGDCYHAMECRRRIREHMKSTGGKYASHEHGGNCMVCGSVNAVWTVLFYHKPTNTYVRTGLDCADKLDEGQHAGDINAFTRNVRDALEAQAGKRKAQALLEQNNLGAAWPIYNATDGKWEEITIRDIVGKLVKYGSVSEKQLNFVRNLLAKIDGRADQIAKREAEAALADDCPNGRLTITGVVLSTKMQDSDFGASMKMLVKAQPGGYKVWCTVPSSTEEIVKGCVVTFAATLKQSANDPKFGFGKRPHLKSVVNGPVPVPATQEELF